MGNCRKCGLDHARLGIQIIGTQLQRSADKTRHMLRIGGGAWSFESTLLEAHPEIREIEIVDRSTGELWNVERSTFEVNAFAFNASGRAQKALSLRHWKTNGEIEHETAGAAPVQPLLGGLERAQDVIYEKAKQPRPRIEPKRRRW